MDAPSPALFEISSTPPQTVKVLVPLPVQGPYDYLVPKGLALVPGDYVKVPLGPREVRGVVWSVTEPLADAKPVNQRKLKTVIEKFEMRRLSDHVMRFVDWVAAYTLYPPGVVLRMVMRSGQHLDAPPSQTGFLAGCVSEGAKLTEKRQQVFEVARQLNLPLSARELANKASVTEGVVRGMAKLGMLQKVEMDPDLPFDPPNLCLPGKTLSAGQQEAAAAINRHIEAQKYACILLDGVTGAGKTEVYFEAAAAALKQDETAQILVLLPEIALTLPFLKRLEERFGVAPAPWHSEVSQAGRRRVWRRVADGSARLVVGARSALFLPYQNLKLIIVDEEHDAAYKQHDGVLYHARDMAVARAAQGKFPVILASATPSLETSENAASGRYDRVMLASRYGGASLPEISTLDMRSYPPEKDQWLSPRMIEAVNETLARGEQSLLFLNRRGYAPLTICRVCGERMTAPDSDTWLVEHRRENKLVCHHTGFSMIKPDTCPHCGKPDSLAACGPGVERVAEEARARWPQQRVEVFSSDTVIDPAAGQALLKAMKEGQIDILVATQVAAKGHHFPNLTLVGVVDADLGLAGGDLRAGERTYQVLSQVAGRAGREAKQGRALLQSYQPDHQVIQALASGDREAFIAAEAQGREMLGFPPYGRLAALILAGDKEEHVTNAARMLAQAVPQGEGVEVWGPAPAPLYRLRGSYRVRFLIKSRRDVSIQLFLKEWLRRVKLPASVRRTVDIDPYAFL